MQNDTGIKSYLVPYSVDIVCNFVPKSVTLDFRTSFQFRHRHGNIYMIKTGGNGH